MPDGLEGRVLARLAESEGTVLFVARDARGSALAEAALAFFAPDIPTLTFPAWDSLPYDRVSPNAEVSAERMSALHALLAAAQGPARRLHHRQRHRPARAGPGERRRARAVGAPPATSSPMERLTQWLETNGFDRTATVREVGEYAVRGGILDLWAPGAEAPIRLDFFGDTLETIRPFDPASSARPASCTRLELVPASEVLLTEETISRFRQNYRAAFGAVLGGDPLYEAVSEGRRFAGMEHWLPFFYERLETLFDYLPDVARHRRPSRRGGARRPAGRRCATITRRAATPPAKGVSAGRRALQADPARGALSLADEWRAALAGRRHARLTPFVEPQEDSGRRSTWAGAPGAPSPPSAPPATSTSSTRWSRTSRRCRRPAARSMLASWSEGARDRLGQVLVDHGLLTR